jgi:hypothetical protein
MDEVDTPRLNIDELYQTKQKIDLNRLELFNKLLKRIHSKIIFISKKRDQYNFCSYVMPEILIGYPNYNLADCLNYIMSSLKNDGFRCRYIHPNLLFISWDHWVPSYVRDEIRKKTGITVDHLGNKIQEKKTSFNLQNTNITSSKKQENINNIYGDKIIGSINRFF